MRPQQGLLALMHVTAELCFSTLSCHSGGSTRGSGAQCQCQRLRVLHKRVSGSPRESETCQRTIVMQARIDVVAELLVGLEVGVELLEGRDADLDVLAYEDIQSAVAPTEPDGSSSPSSS